MDNNELQHFGVPGMKWGVRKEQYKSLNRRQKRALRAYGTAKTVSSMLNKKGASESSQKIVKDTKRLKANLEKALKLKIDDAAIERETKVNAVVSGILTGIFNPTVSSLVRSARADKYAQMGEKELKQYLES